MKNAYFNFMAHKVPRVSFKARLAELDYWLAIRSGAKNNSPVLASIGFRKVFPVMGAAALLPGQRCQGNDLAD